MVVCVCNAIREKDIREAARTGMCGVEAIYQHLGCDLNCCQCVPFAEAIVREEIRIAA